MATASARYGGLEFILQQKRTFTDHQRSRDALTQVMCAVSQGHDLSSLFSSVVKFLASHDPLVKRLSCMFVCVYANTCQDMLVLAINTLQKDCMDANPLIRAFATKTLSSSKMFIPHSIKYIKHGLTDSSAYVRRKAIVACSRLHNQEPETVSSNDLCGTLIAGLHDSDPVACCHKLQVLEEIQDGELVMDRSTAFHLINRLSSFTELGQCQILNFLKRYVPETEDECLDIMNILDVNLQQGTNVSILIATLELFFVVTKMMKTNLIKDVVARAAPALLQNVDSSNTRAELCYSTLDFLYPHVKEFPDVFSDHFRSFFPVFSDQPYLNSCRLNMLLLLINESNVHEVVEHLVTYAKSGNDMLEKSSIKGLGVLALRKCDMIGDIAVGRLLDLLNTKRLSCSQQVLHCLEKLPMLKETQVTELVTHLEEMSASTSNLTHPFIRLLGRYGHALQNSPYILERLCDDLNVGLFENERAELVLTATLCVFIHQPAECMPAMTKIFSVCLDSNDVDVDLKEKAGFYHLLMETDINKLKDIILMT